MNTIAIVTGASRGIGLALAEQLARECTILVTVARTESLKSVAKITEENHTIHHHFVADLSDTIDVRNLCSKLSTILQKKADRYLLINNAGVLGPMVQYNGLTPGLSAEIDNAFHINVAAAITLSSAFLRDMAKHINTSTETDKPSIQIINISSGAGRSAYPGWGVYCATKAALDRYSEVVQLEAPWAQIVALAPGVVDTNMQENIRSSDEKDFPNLQRFKDLHANQGLSAPADVAAKILAYSLSPDFGKQTLADIRKI
ncbi:SDR family NAD(P)-dependent oxidoreductase [Pelistega europaea]|uniref:SDR family NAD(P)-dependent oxidoreductase n=1 Tax=Pelistega europaea TaxID=106147 RepID=A0A7Y4P434_9BURK|nr:SDR family NAD(P)-dependent oxidoreductase [Pelistega europaea]NOL49081.1 SDR family NAD(P)-dependent oxidoreductase [Pelistega europaea]